MPSQQEWIGALRTGVAQFSALRKANQTEDPNLAGADLRGLNLRDAPLDRANLKNADLRGADLAGANLGMADLTDADLRGASLVETTLHRVALRGADLRGCLLGGFAGRGRICLHESSFQSVRWDRPALESLLAVLNTNPEWEIQYQIVPRRRA